MRMRFIFVALSYSHKGKRVENEISLCVSLSPLFLFFFNLREHKKQALNFSAADLLISLLEIQKHEEREMSPKKEGEAGE